MLLAGGSGGKRGAPTCVAATFSYKGKPPGVTRVPASLYPPAGFARLLLGINNV